MAGLGIAHAHQSHVRQLAGTHVVDLQGHHVVLVVGYGERVLKVVAAVEVAQHEGRATAFHHFGEELQCLGDIGAAAIGVEVEHLAYDIENVLAALLRRDILLYAVREEYDTYLVVVLYGTESYRCGYLSHHVFLELTGGAEVERARHVDEQHHRELALLLKHLHVGPVEARSDVPVDVAHIVAELVFPHFRERHSAPLESRVILAGKDILTQTAGLYLYLANFL